MMLDRVEEQISKLLVSPTDEMNYNDISYKDIPNEGYNTALVSLFRDVVEIRKLGGDPKPLSNPKEAEQELRTVSRLPSISILPADGAKVENATAQAQSRLELGTTRIFWPLLIRMTLLQSTGARYDDARREYSHEGKVLSLTDQYVLAWDDLDILLNSHTLGIVNTANKSQEARFPVSMTDALITDLKLWEGTAAPWEIVDFTLLIILNQDKTPTRNTSAGRDPQTASPPTISSLKRNR